VIERAMTPERVREKMEEELNAIDRLEADLKRTHSP
jgi:hypothetical protein